MENKEKDETDETDVEAEDPEEFQLEVAPLEFLTTLDDVSRIMSQNKGIIKGIRC